VRFPKGASQREGPAGGGELPAPGLLLGPAGASQTGCVANLAHGERTREVARQLKAGTVTLSTPFTSFSGLPFGGFKQSGIGRERARETLLAYTETKTVVQWTAPAPPNPFQL